MEEKRIFRKYLPIFTKLSVDDTRIILKDSRVDCIVELDNKKGVLYCQFCKRDNCPHVGFCWSFPEIYE